MLYITLPLKTNGTYLRQYHPRDAPECYTNLLCRVLCERSGGKSENVHRGRGLLHGAADRAHPAGGVGAWSVHVVSCDQGSVAARHRPTSSNPRALFDDWPHDRRRLHVQRAQGHESLPNVSPLVQVGVCG